MVTEAHDRRTRGKNKIETLTGEKKGRKREKEGQTKKVDYEKKGREKDNRGKKRIQKWQTSATCLRRETSCAGTKVIPNHGEQMAVRKDCGSSITTSLFWVRNLISMDPTEARHRTALACTGRKVQRCTMKIISAAILEKHSLDIMRFSTQCIDSKRHITDKSAAPVPHPMHLPVCIFVTHRATASLRAEQASGELYLLPLPHRRNPRTPGHSRCPAHAQSAGPSMDVASPVIFCRGGEGEMTHSSQLQGCGKGYSSWLPVIWLVPKAQAPALVRHHHGRVEMIILPPSPYGDIHAKTTLFPTYPVFSR